MSVLSLYEGPQFERAGLCLVYRWSGRKVIRLGADVQIRFSDYGSLGFLILNA